MAFTRSLTALAVLPATIVTGFASAEAPGGAKPQFVEVEADTLPEAFGAWTMLLGDWDLQTRRFSFEGEVLESETGATSFSISPDGRQILEFERTVIGDNPTEALQVFAVDPRNDSIEIARVDTGHYSIGVLRGVISGDRIELVEKHPNPDHQVIRKVEYTQQDDDQFTRRLFFSTDQGETWFVRFEAVYTRTN